MAGDEHVYAFSSFRIDPARRSILRAGRPVRVTAKVFDLLMALIRSRDRVITRDELMTQLWPDTIVEVGNISVNLSALRKALEDKNADQPIIETLPRQGYRFVPDILVEVRQLADPAPSRATRSTGSAPPCGTDLQRADASLMTRQHDPALARLPPLVGRDEEMETLRGLFEVAALGAAKVAFLHGEPGIGKTTLAEHFVSHVAKAAPNVRVAVGRCLQQHGAGEAYLPFLGVFGALLSGEEAEPTRRLFMEFAPSWCPLFPAVFTLPGAAEGPPGDNSGQQLLRQARDVIAAIAERTPLVIVLDDLHWADPSSIDLLRLLTQQAVPAAGSGAPALAQRARWLVLGTFRTAEVSAGAHPLATVPHALLHELLHELRLHDQCVDVSLNPLSSQAVDDYLRGRFGAHRFPREFVTLLVQKTHGHPLLCTRLLQWLVDRDDIAWKDDAFQLVRPLSELVLEIPESVESLILRKLDLLTLEDQRVLTYASIEGEEFTSTIVAELLGQDEVDVDERLERLARVHRWFDPLGEEAWPSGKLASRYRFGHALYRDYLHSKFVPRRRRQLHQRAALALTEHHSERAAEIASRLAVHFEESGDVRRAVEYRTHAGHNAKRRFAHREAEAHYSQAIRSAEDLPPEERTRHELELLGERASRRHDLGAFQDALHDFNRLRDIAAQAGADAVRWHALLGGAWTCLMMWDRAGCQLRLREILQLVEASGDDRWRARASNLAAAICLHLDGALELARGHVAQSLALARELDDEESRLVGTLVSSHVEFLQSQYEAAVVATSELIEHTRSSRFFGPMKAAVAVRYFRALAQLNLGRVSCALSELKATRAYAERVECWISLGTIDNGIAGVHLELGHYAEAGRLSHEVLELPSERAHERARLHARLDLALAHLRGPAPDLAAAARAVCDAERSLEIQALHCHTLVAQLRLLATRSELFLAQRQLALAAQSARELLSLAGPQRAQKQVALAHWLLARVALGGDAPALAKSELSAALDALANAPCPRLNWRLWAELAGTHRELSDFPAAETALSRARAGIRQMALGIDDAVLLSIFLTSPSVRQALAGAAEAS